MLDFQVLDFEPVLNLIYIFQVLSLAKREKNF